MSKFFVVFVVILACVAAKRQKLSVVADSASEASGHVSSIAYGGRYSSHGNKKYASAKELTSLARSSAQQARTAVINQGTAGITAAAGAQSGFASAADQASNGARVAKVAAQVIVQYLEEQVDDAHRQVEAERGLYDRFLEAATRAQAAVQQTQEQLLALATVVDTIQQAAGQAELVASAATQNAAAQHQMIQDAEQRLARLHERLQEARAGQQLTEQAANKAEAAANAAQNNAAASAQLAVVNSARSQVDEHESDFHHHH